MWPTALRYQRAPYIEQQCKTGIRGGAPDSRRCNLVATRRTNFRDRDFVALNWEKKLSRCVCLPAPRRSWTRSQRLWFVIVAQRHIPPGGYRNRHPRIQVRKVTMTIMGESKQGSYDIKGDQVILHIPGECDTQMKMNGDGTLERTRNVQEGPRAGRGCLHWVANCC